MSNELVRRTGIFVASAFLCVLSISGCGERSAPQTEPAGSEKIETSTEAVRVEAVPVPAGDPLGYITAVSAEASSFDQTPDWAPDPNAMNAADGDMLTRWSSDYYEGPQWIYFDLGQERVVSNIIIRWERAYAKDYAIMVSNDKAFWQEVYREPMSDGGTDEINFPAVKCRYIRIQSIERVNEDWGISIWETEVYGPLSLNPGVSVTKEEYLTAGDDAGERKKAEEALAALEQEAVLLSENPFQKGLVYTSWMGEEFLTPASDITLAYLRNAGFDSIAIMVPAYQDRIDSKVVFTNDTPDGDTPTDEALRHVISSCKKVGLRVMLKPHVDPRTDEPRINIMPSEEWFDSFEAFTLRYAKLAQETGCEMYCIGTELEATTFEAWTHRWVGIIDKVKEVYSGILTYAANWTEYKEVPFWDKVDFIGIDAYFPLSGSEEPTLEELVSSWERIADEIEAWREKHELMDKGVVLTEIGYPSARGAAIQPWAAISRIEDQKAQADALEAVFAALTKRSWFEGYYVWQYFPQDRWSPLGFTVKGKMSEEVMDKWLNAE
jgi:hypothetical protein